MALMLDDCYLVACEPKEIQKNYDAGKEYLNIMNVIQVINEFNHVQIGNIVKTKNKNKNSSKKW